MQDMRPDDVTSGESGGTNISPEVCLDDQRYLNEVAWQEIFSVSCVGCHQEGGPAEHTRMVFKSPGEPEWDQHNLAQVTAVIEAEEEGLPLLLLNQPGDTAKDTEGALSSRSQALSLRSCSASPSASSISPTTAGDFKMGAITSRSIRPKLNVTSYDQGVDSCAASRTKSTKTPSLTC